MSITEKVADEILVRSARHCCLCRKFSPLSLHIHHVVEKKDGGTDDIDNLIALCLICHANVHTQTQMSRSFSPRELKMHREQVYAMVEAGKLPAAISLTETEVQSIAAAITASANAQSGSYRFSEREVELLVACVCENSNEIQYRNDGLSIIGRQHFFFNPPEGGKLPKEILNLLSHGMLVYDGTSIIITDTGRKYVEDNSKTTASYTIKKVKCFSCGLHFAIYSWDDERHKCSNIHCPECGKSDGAFIVWSQKELGFIFQRIPGNASIYDIKLPERFSTAAPKAKGGGD